MYLFLFLADMQLGAYATFSGMNERDVGRYAHERDMQVRPVPRVEGFEWDAARYSEAVDAVNSLRPDLVLIGGDMIDDTNAEDQYDEFMRITDRIDDDIPIKWVPGNHDIADDNVVPTMASIATYRAAFGPDFYAFDHGPIRFVALNTVVIDHPELVPGEWETQRAFIEAELAEAAERSRPVVMLGHHPLFTRHADEEDDYWNLPLVRRKPILDMVHRHGVPLALAGHWHRNSHAGDGEFEMITTGPVGYPLGFDPSGFRVVEVSGGRISHAYRPLDA
ncbi:metallophosphoesterase [bacterium]|nr:metallophosphoesterase [bacterium]